MRSDDYRRLTRYLRRRVWWWRPTSFFSQFLKEKTFVEFQLLNERDEPMANEAYELTLPDGTLMTGALDENGFVHVANIPRGVAA